MRQKRRASEFPNPWFPRRAGQACMELGATERLRRDRSEMPAKASAISAG